MAKVTLATLKQDVIVAAMAVAVETDPIPPEGVSVIVTEADRRLWAATRRLINWERKKRKR
jgi:phenylpyruvate tautomerase PptA (4-oxalocrotonate tautomerase family)